MVCMCPEIVLQENLTFMCFDLKIFSSKRVSVFICASMDLCVRGAHVHIWIKVCMCHLWCV